ncbi:RlmE family RNA methyltransferase [Vitreimonas flagellata]|uniref:RlmE family RNA methyltransferase n=1 Tax=Vitreimonas flagellata TaxID=2560861 RepID=UPI001074CCEF|nr:RlmE family RNA methyltransferase [Vitreimonas flagellata]
MSDEEEPKRRWTGKPAGGGGDRQMFTRVKNKKVKESSRNWLKRQLNDPYVAKARAEGYRARAAYKLIELDEQFHFMKRGARVIDLGAAPGGWLQVAVARGALKVVGVDLLPIEPLPGAILFQMDLLAPETPGVLMGALGGQPDIVLSDMAANTTGHQRTDQIRTGALAEAAAEFAIDHCAPGGTFVTKAFQGGLDSALLARLKQAFSTVKHAKPPASRAESAEIYVVAQGRKPPA